MEYQLIRFRIDYLSDLILSGQLALPDFQRDFVWGPPKIADLLQSIGREWPIGSLLILEGPTEFASKSIELGPDTSSDKIKYYLLDGQQRITSIFHAVNDLSDVVYYIDLGKIYEESLDEDFVFYTKRNKFEKSYPDIQACVDGDIIKISDLYETESFFEWLSYLNDQTKKREYTKIRRNYLYGLNNGVYNIPATVLPRDVDFSALAKIFEGMNTNSVRLTTSDLLVAANLPKGVNLRQMWKDFREQSPFVEFLDLDLLDILKVCALIERDKGNSTVKGVKQSDLIRVNPIVYRDNWDIACEQIIKASQFAENNLGVLNKNMLPSSSNLIALSFILKYISNVEIITCLWILWILDETFAQSSHTRLLTELSERRKLEWDYIDVSYLNSKFSAEIDLLLQKPCGANGYLMRGISAIRTALAINNDTQVKRSFLDEKEKVEPYSADTGVYPKKNDKIISTRIGIKKSVNSIKPVADPKAQEIRTETFFNVVNMIVHKDK